MQKFQIDEIIEFTGQLHLEAADLPHSLHFLINMVPRKYRVVEKAPDGGKGIGYKCVLLDDAGEPLKDSHHKPLLFFVKVPKEGGEYQTEDRVRYMDGLTQAAINERLTWVRLKDIHHLANVGFDRCVADDDGVRFPMTAQRYLLHGETLNEKIQYTTKQFWLPNEDTFLRYALMLAELINKVHSRRVTHGDIHPGNIFVTKKQEAWRTDSRDGDEHFVLIDFGAAIFEQGNQGEVNINHEFRAPERNPDRASYVISEAVDVYSFGKILYVLCTGLRGTDALIPPEGYEDNRKRRKYIRERLRSPYSENPSYLDIIASCCSYDPINRPSMSQVVAYLKRLLNAVISTYGQDAQKPKSLAHYINDMKRQSQKWNEALNPVAKSIFEMMAREKVEEVIDMFNDEPTTQAIVRGTRWDTINSLTMLFDQMKEGDSWTTMTTPEVWQGRGLGLDGRYMSSNILALKRNASIRRFLGLSVDQLGKDWSKGLAKSLENSGSADLKLLGERLKSAAHHVTDTYADIISEGYQEKYRIMVYNYIDAWHDGVYGHHLENLVATELFQHDRDHVKSSFLTANGLHMGLIIYEDINCLREAKKANALSLLLLSGSKFNILTEMHGRLPRTSDRRLEKEPAAPSLVGFRLFESLQPKMFDERMIRFYDLVHRNPGHSWRGAVNIGPHLNELREAIMRQFDY